MPDVLTLADSARQIMAEHPSIIGWQRTESRSCGGQHPARPPGAGPLVLWRRQRDYFDDETGQLLSLTDDPPLWVVERISTALCVGKLWVHRIRLAKGLVADMGIPWDISDGELGPGSTVTLATANGRWVWELVGERSCCCGGYLARWAD